MRLCLLVTSELTPIQYHQHAFPNVRWTSSQLRYQTECGKAHEASTQHKEFQTAACKAVAFPWKNKHVSCLSSVKWAALKMCIQITLHGLKWLYLGICIYLHKHLYMQ